MKLHTSIRDRRCFTKFFKKVRMFINSFYALLSGKSAQKQG